MACKRSAVRFRLAPPFPAPHKKLLPLSIYLTHKGFMNGSATPKGLQKSLINMLSGALLLTLGGCAQVQNFTGFFADGPTLQANKAVAARQNIAQNAQAAVTAQRLNMLESEKRSMAQKLQATEQAALLVQIEGGDIKLNKTANLPSCQTAKAAISGMPGSEKQAAPPYQSAFSVGSVSPYMPHHLLISTCLPLAMVAPL